jgi:outer membrane protein assembly factor BamB
VNKLSLSVLAVALIGSVIAVAQSSPRDYPQWRGRNQDGQASAFLPPKTWPDKLTRRWRVDVGDGYGTPLLVSNTVYCFTRRDEDEVFAALDADSGRELWQTRYPAPYKPGSPAAAHGAGPKATPLFHRGKLYTLGISGIVSAFDAATGKLVWQKPAPPEHPF